MRAPRPPAAGRAGGGSRRGFAAGPPRARRGGPAAPSPLQRGWSSHTPGLRPRIAALPSLRQPASCPQVELSYITVGLQLKPGIVAGFTHVTTRQTIGVVPPIWVL